MRWLVGRFAFGQADWFEPLTAERGAGIAATALVLGIVVESWGLSMGRWAYLPSMPRVPGTDLGVVPILQLRTLALLVFIITARFQRRRPRTLNQ
jgi:hypothetical protein